MLTEFKINLLTNYCITAGHYRSKASSVFTILDYIKQIRWDNN